MQRKSKRQRRGAFTLIEVLLVAGILAVLAAFAIPSLLNQATKAKNDLARAGVGRNGPIAKALDNYKFDMGKFPDTDEGLQVLFMAKDRVEDERYDGPYMQGTYEELMDPWGKSFEFRSPGEFHEDGYDLWSRGPDGIDDGGKAGSDDIKNWIEK